MRRSMIYTLKKYKDLYKTLYEMEVRKSTAEKSMTEFFGDRTDN